MIDGFSERIAFDSQLLGDFRSRLALVEPLLSFREHRRCQDIGTSRGAWGKESFEALFAIGCHTAFDAVSGDAKSTNDVDLPTGTLANQLGDEHPERGPIIGGMLEDGLDAAEVGPLTVLLNDTDSIIDLRGAIGDKWEQCLWHSTFLLKVT